MKTNRSLKHNGGRRINKLKTDRKAIRTIKLPGNQRKERRMGHMYSITAPLRDNFF